MMHWYDRDGEPMTRDEWGVRFADEAYKHVAFDRVDDVEVSTVWMGLSHRFVDAGPPLIFETMVFGGPFDEWQARYCTEEAALIGHARIVDAVREAAASKTLAWPELDESVGERHE